VSMCVVVCRHKQQEADAAAAAAADDPNAPPAGSIVSKSSLLGQDPDRPIVEYVTASFKYKARSATELSFSAGDRIRVLSQFDKQWWKGTVNDELGFFPANHVIGLEAINLPDYTRARQAASAAAAAGGAAANGHAAKSGGDDEERDYQDSEYFDSYSTLIIHHQMLSDTVRTLAYQKAVHHLKPLIEGKIGKQLRALFAPSTAVQDVR
jgi:hypothetical protein